LINESSALLIMVATSTKWLDKPSVCAHLPSLVRTIEFPPYSAPELKEILLMRAKMGLKTYDERGIECLSQIIADEYEGNAWYAIRILSHLGLKNSWDKASIEDAILETIEHINPSTMKEISRDALELLLIIIEKNKTLKRGECEIKSIFSAWNKRTGKGFIFFDLLEELEEHGLISTYGGGIIPTPPRTKLIMPSSLYTGFRNPGFVKKILKERGLS